MAGNYDFDVRQNVAGWLLANCQLTHTQISEYLSISRERIDRIGSGDQPLPGKPDDPINRNWLRRVDIDRCEANPQWALPTSLFKEPKVELEELSIDKIHREKEVFYEACVVRAYFIFYGRNAWHSTWIKRFYKRRSIWLTLVGAKEAAERWRTQGSVLNIEELPAVALLSNDRVILLVSVNAGQHLSGLAGNRIGTKPLADMMHRALEIPRDLVTTLAARYPVTIAGLEKVQAGKLLHYTAFSNGSSFRLGWDFRQSATDSLPAARQLARWCTSKLDRAPVLGREAGR